MRIKVTQPNTEFASQCVTIRINDHRFELGPGDSKEVESDISHCEVRAQCGSFCKNVTVRHDSEIIIRWDVTNEDMRLEWKAYNIRK